MTASTAAGSGGGGGAAPAGTAHSARPNNATGQRPAADILPPSALEPTPSTGIMRRPGRLPWKELQDAPFPWRDQFMRRPLLLLVAGLLFVVAGCGSSAPSPFAGTWKVTALPAGKEITMW